MERFVVLLFVFALSACVAQVPVPDGLEGDAVPVRVTSASALETRGPESAAELTGWYNSVVDDCGNPGLSAPLCSGVMLRATENNPAFLPWDPSPSSIDSGGVSFSWLRQDSNFSTLVYAYRNGFIFYPVLRTPPGKNSGIGVLCVFPHDGGTLNRPSLQGCGPNAFYPTDSRPCTDQGINTTAQWLAKFNVDLNRYHYQCGWSIREGERDQAARFMAAIGARNGMADAAWSVQNELRLATWATGSGATLPIQSFFYVAGNLDARAKAQNDQLRYFLSYDQVVPIVSVSLPSSRAGRATFSYSEGDQADLDPDRLQFDTSPVTLSGRAFIISARHDILPPFNAGNSITRTALGGRPPYTYTSSNPAVAVVSAAGQVTPRANGSASISVRDSAGATAAYTITFTGVVQVAYLGRMSHQQAQSAVAGRGERLPADTELVALQQAFAGRWPHPAGYYWSTRECPLSKHAAFYIHTVSDSGYCFPFTYSEEVVGLR